MVPGGRGPPSAAQLEQQFQDRIARAKEAARLGSIAAVARSQPPPAGPSFNAVPGIPMRPPPPISTAPGPFRPPPIPMPSTAVPLDIKNRIDRLVEFVARNGDAFEATARVRERDNPDFAFLRPGEPFSDYYQWKKTQVCGDGTALPLARVGNSATTPPPETDLLNEMSVGAMANVCKLAKASGVPAYAPIPREMAMNAGTLPPVEPARLAIRLSDFYREERRQA